MNYPKPAFAAVARTIYDGRDHHTSALISHGRKRGGLNYMDCLHLPSSATGFACVGVSSSSFLVIIRASPDSALRSTKTDKHAKRKFRRDGETQQLPVGAGISLLLHKLIPPNQSYL
ncbi:conserved hypothetical protein [Ricinus communis]|uniref:Uncharacterized protein n=1 Tax=Ricinus communis TaxID=3988 RepID=B9T2X1_RICCO|nr:conserved hypothetical protein [Ricinus communis]